MSIHLNTIHVFYNQTTNGKRKHSPANCGNGLVIVVLNNKAKSQLQFTFHSYISHITKVNPFTFHFITRCNTELEK